MVRTAEELKAYNKAYNIKNAEKRKVYYIKNAEKIKTYTKAYSEANSEKLKKYRQEHAEKAKAYNKTWVRENPEKNKKSQTIGNWKRNGLICNDCDLLYEAYLQSTNCEDCGCEYSKRGDGIGRFRCMDHDHTSGLFRNFLCSPCNLNRH